MPMGKDHVGLQPGQELSHLATLCNPARAQCRRTMPETHCATQRPIEVRRAQAACLIGAKEVDIARDGPVAAQRGPTHNSVDPADRAVTGPEKHEIDDSASGECLNEAEQPLYAPVMRALGHWRVLFAHHQDTRKSRVGRISRAGWRPTDDLWNPLPPKASPKERQHVSRTNRPHQREAGMEQAPPVQTAP